jgi:hypothetical protein
MILKPKFNNISPGQMKMILGFLVIIIILVIAYFALKKKNSTITPAHVVKMIPAQISTLTTAQVLKMTPAQISTITAAQYGELIKESQSQTPEEDQNLKKLFSEEQKQAIKKRFGELIREGK